MLKTALFDDLKLRKIIFLQTVVLNMCCPPASTEILIASFTLPRPKMQYDFISEDPKLRAAWCPLRQKVYECVSTCDILIAYYYIDFVISFRLLNGVRLWYTNKIFISTVESLIIWETSFFYGFLLRNDVKYVLNWFLISWQGCIPADLGGHVSNKNKFSLGQNTKRLEGEIRVDNGSTITSQFL